MVVRVEDETPLWSAVSGQRRHRLPPLAVLDQAAHKAQAARLHYLHSYGLCGYGLYRLPVFTTYIVMACVVMAYLGCPSSLPT